MRHLVVPPDQDRARFGQQRGRGRRLAFRQRRPDRRGVAGQLAKVERRREGKHCPVPVDIGKIPGRQRRGVGRDKGFAQRILDPGELGHLGVFGIERCQGRREIARIGIERPAARRHAVDMGGDRRVERLAADPVARTGKAVGEAGDKLGAVVILVDAQARRDVRAEADRGRFRLR